MHKKWSTINLELHKLIRVELSESYRFVYPGLTLKILFMENVNSLLQQLAESRKREKDLQSKLDDLTDFIENASLPLHWVNGSGIIIWANKAELELLGYSREEYLGKHISNFHADKTICEDILTRLIKKETLNNYPAMLRTKSNAIVPVLINSNVRWDGDKFIHTRCFTRKYFRSEKTGTGKSEPDQ